MQKDASWLRSERIKGIKKMMMSNIASGKLLFHKVLVWTMMEFGLTELTARSYMNLIIENEGWIVVDGVLKAEL